MSEDDTDAGISLKDVAAAHAAGRLAEARAICDALLAQDPQSGDAHMWSGSIAMSQLRWTEAVDALERALGIRADPWSAANLGACYSKLGRLPEAERSLRLATELHPDLYGAHISLAGVLHGLERYDEALERLDIAARIDPDDHKVDLRRGCTLAELGRYDEAQQAFERAAARTGDFIYPRLVRFDRATFESVACLPPRLEAPQLAVCAGGDFRGVVLVSCNPAYARKYGLPFLRSYAEHAAPDHLLHIHIPDPDARIVDELRRTARDAGLRALSISTESSPFAAEEAQQRKAYYACARLLHLPYWLESYRVPMLVLDVDFIVETSLDVLFTAAAGHDVGLNARVPKDSPWLDVIANVIVANPTAAARRYFLAVGGYAYEQLRREPRAWLVDQAALFCVLRMFERFAEPPAVRWLPQAHQSGLFHIGHAYEHLLEDPRFVRYSLA